MPSYGKWTPLCILALLLLVLLYSSYYLVKEVRQKWSGNKVGAEDAKGMLHESHIFAAESKRRMKSKQKSIKEKA